MIHEIGLSEYMNCVLVTNDVRNAMLLQAADYKEITHEDPIIKNKLKAILKHFPLKHCLLEFGNVLISKKQYTVNDITSDEKMGEILGYPCAKDFKNATYSISIDAEFISGSVQIIGMCAKDDYPILNTFASDALRVLQNDIGINDIGIKDVTVNMKPILNVQNIIDKLILNIELNKDEIYTVGNCIYNIGFPVLSTYSFQYTNPFHIGIITTLLSYFINDPIDPFTPLQRFPVEYKKWDIINEKLELKIIDNLNKLKV